MREVQRNKLMRMMTAENPPIVLGNQKEPKSESHPERKLDESKYDEHKKEMKMPRKKSEKSEKTPEETPKEEVQEESVVDMDLVSVPDIPLPVAESATSEVTDECDVAFKYAFVGAGQAGARMVESFWNLGYRRVCAINTTNQDLVHIKGTDDKPFPEENKLVMDIGEGGAGKDPEKGKKAIEQYYEDVYDLMRRSFGGDFERIIVCHGAGGGTGSGSVEALIEIAHDIAKSFKLEGGEKEPAVGALVSMPMASEGQRVNMNAAKVLDKLFSLVGRDRGKLASRSLSPLIVVDNERINKIYPGLSVDDFWTVANRSITSLFHLFNSIAGKASKYTVFDRADYNDVLGSGVLTFGATPLAKFESETDISFAIRDNVKKNILVADLDLRAAKRAACVFVGHPEVYKSVPQKYLEHGLEMLTRIMRENSVVHRGIYPSNVKGADGKPGMVVYTIFGELGRPEERMNEIYRLGGRVNL